MPKAIDLTGQRFGRLTAVEKVGKDKHGNSLWKCVCDCGSEKKISQNSLSSGVTKSCGCLMKEAALENIKKHNQIQCIDSTNLSLLTAKKSKANTSGIKGVSWNAKTKKWRADIGFKNKLIYLGLFSTLEAAIKARALAEEQYFQPILDKYSTDIKPDLMEVKE